MPNSAVASPSRHTTRCIQELYVDSDKLAEVIAQTYGSVEPLTDDYDAAQRVIEYLRTCTRAGQVAHYTACGFDVSAIAEQLGLSPRTVAEIKKENDNAHVSHAHQ